MKKKNKNMLTEKQKEIIKVIEKNPCFSLNKIAKSLGKGSVSNIHTHVQNLTKNGYVYRNHKRLFLTKKVKKKLYWIPLYEVFQYDESSSFEKAIPINYIPFSSQFIHENEEKLFLIKKIGQEMCPNIIHGELIVFKYENNFEKIKNDAVVLIEINKSLLIKRLKRHTSRKDVALLVSDNKEEYNPIKYNSNMKIIAKRIVLKDKK